MGPFGNPQTNLLQATSNDDGVSIKVTSVRFQLWKRSKSHPVLKVSCGVFWAGYSYTPENERDNRNIYNHYIEDVSQSPMKNGDVPFTTVG